MSAPLPLSGITVVDFTQVFMGPSCTQLLGDYGADVIKIERLGQGDLSRSSIEDPDGPDNPIFLSINRNKRSLAVDTRRPEGMQIVRDLLRDADVIVSNFRAGVMERLGLGYESVKELNPAIIWASGTGFGSSGPYSKKGGQDVIAQAFSGVMWRRASPQIPLSIFPTTIADYTTGMHLLQGILLALLARQRTGDGQRVEVSMYESMLHMQMQEACMQLNRGFEVNWAEKPLTGVFETTDGALCIVGAFRSEPLRDICRALEIDDLSQDPRFATESAQATHRSELQAILAARIATAATQHWTERLDAQDILCAPVRTLAQALDDEQTLANDLVVEVPRADGTSFQALRAPIMLSDAPDSPRSAPPTLGEHTVEILTERGHDAAAIEHLIASGVVQ